MFRKSDGVFEMRNDIDNKEQKYKKTCSYCGAVIYSNSKDRECYKCGNKMIAIFIQKKIGDRR